MMAIQSEDIPLMVFKTCIQEDMGEIPLDGKMLVVLMKVDGKSNGELIAQAVRMNMKTVSTILSRLFDYHLIENVTQNPNILGKEFFDFLTDHLSVVAGPISQLLVEDATNEIGQGSASIPKTRAAELIDLLARQIPEEKQRLQFIQSMMQKLKEL